MIPKAVLFASYLFAASTALGVEEASQDLSPHQLSWDVVGAMPPQAGCQGISSEFNTAISNLFQDPRLAQVQAWVAHVGLAMPPARPASDEAWTSERCLGAVTQVLNLFDENEELIRRMVEETGPRHQ